MGESFVRLDDDQRPDPMALCEARYGDPWRSCLLEPGHSGDHGQRERVGEARDPMAPVSDDGGSGPSSDTGLAATGVICQVDAVEAAKALGVPPPLADEMHLAVMYESLEWRDYYAGLNRTHYGHRVNTGLLLHEDHWTAAAVITVKVPKIVEEH